MSKLTKKERSIASKFKKREKAKEQAKKFYDRADALTLEIAKQSSLRPLCEFTRTENSFTCWRRNLTSAEFWDGATEPFGSSI